VNEGGSVALNNRKRAVSSDTARFSFIVFKEPVRAGARNLLARPQSPLSAIHSDYESPITSPFAPEIVREMEVLQARIEEKISQIRRDREEGEVVMEETRRISQSNTRALEDLGVLIARLR